MTPEEDHMLVKQLTSVGRKKKVIRQKGSQGSCEGSSLKGKDSRANRHAHTGQEGWQGTSPKG